MKVRIHNRKSLEPFRKRLRAYSTPSEAYLWTHLQQKKLEGRKFRRQHSIGNFIVDFYCSKEKLIIELDGEVHNNPEAEKKDAKRTAFLEKMGFTVLRFENRMVFEHLSQVLQEIKNNFMKKKTRTLTKGSHKKHLPFPREGGMAQP